MGGPSLRRRREEHLHIELEDAGLFAGDLAERQSSLRSFTLDQDRFITESAKVLALAVARTSPADEPIQLVTGLPISTFRERADELATTLADATRSSRSRGGWSVAAWSSRSPR